MTYRYGFSKKIKKIKKKKKKKKKNLTACPKETGKATVGRSTAYYKFQCARRTPKPSTSKGQGLDNQLKIGLLSENKNWKLK